MKASASLYVSGRFLNIIEVQIEQSDLENSIAQ